MRKKKKEGMSIYKIALLDDEKGIIDSLSTIIKQIGYTSRGFTNPLEAIHALEEERFDLLILDYLMEPINGDEVIRRIREFDKDIYILLLTGHSEIAPPLETIRNLDIQGYCEKSDKFDQLILLIESGIKSVKQRRMINDLIYAKKAAEEANHAKSEFLANVSHELRTPLNVILSAVQLLSYYYENDLHLEKESVNKHLKSMKQNGLRLVRLVDNILDTTKIDAGHFELIKQNYDIVDVMKKIIESIEEYINLKGIKLAFSTDIEERIILCDVNVVERAVLNLISNAVKYVRENGHISVGIHNTPQFVEISVKDDGIGIPKDMQGVIFERFKQLDDLLTRKHEGSGIGLSLTKTLIEMHGGKISVQSEVGKGSEFVIYLPNKSADQEEGMQPHHRYSQSLTERINVEFSDIYNNN